MFEGVGPTLAGHRKIRGGTGGSHVLSGIGGIPGREVSELASKPTKLGFQLVLKTTCVRLAPGLCQSCSFFGGRLRGVPDQRKSLWFWRYPVPPNVSAEEAEEASFCP